MSGKFYPIIKFTFRVDKARRGWLSVEPFASVHGYGLIVKVTIEKTGGAGDNRYIYEVVLEEVAILQSDIIECFLTETFCEFIEQLYFNKAPVELCVPFMAMFLRMNFPELLERYNIDVSEYVKEVEVFTGGNGFSHDRE